VRKLKTFNKIIYSLETAMNKHVPYVWRKSYCNDERRSQNFLRLRMKKPGNI
jgi:hypothetical protein